MKKLITSITFLSFLLFLVTPALANDSNKDSSSRYSSVKKEVRSDIKEKIVSKRRESLESYFNKMIKRFEAATERLTKLADRIGTRIAKIEEENPGKNLTSQKTQLTNAKNKLTTLKTDIASLKTKFETVLSSEDPKESFKTFREDVTKVKKSLVEVHQILMKIVRELKGLKLSSPTPTP